MQKQDAIGFRGEGALVDLTVLIAADSPEDIVSLWKSLLAVGYRPIVAPIETAYEIYTLIGPNFVIVTGCDQLRNNHMRNRQLFSQLRLLAIAGQRVVCAGDIMFDEANYLTVYKEGASPIDDSHMAGVTAKDCIILPCMTDDIQSTLS